MPATENRHESAPSETVPGCCDSREGINIRRKGHSIVLHVHYLSCCYDGIISNRYPGGFAIVWSWPPSTSDNNQSMELNFCVHISVQHKSMH